MAKRNRSVENMAVIEKENMWRGRLVLVTGGAGFIGSWLSLVLLKKGARVVILDKKKELLASIEPWGGLKPGVTYVSGDVCDVGLIHRLFEKYKFQTIFHLAAQAIVGAAYENPAEALDTNVRGTWNMLEVCRQKNMEAEIVIASSVKAYGTQ